MLEDNYYVWLEGLWRNDNMSEETTEVGVDESLFPCPFCGGEARYIENRETRELTPRYDIGCSTDGCLCHNGVDWCKPKDEIRRMWNRRASDNMRGQTRNMNEFDVALDAVREARSVTTATETPAGFDNLGTSPLDLSSVRAVRASMLSFRDASGDRVAMNSIRPSFDFGPQEDMPDISEEEAIRRETKRVRDVNNSDWRMTHSDEMPLEPLVGDEEPPELMRVETGMITRSSTMAHSSERIQPWIIGDHPSGASNEAIPRPEINFELPGTAGTVSLPRNGNDVVDTITVSGIFYVWSPLHRRWTRHRGTQRPLSSLSATETAMRERANEQETTNQSE
jgi:hypothetical protein